VLAKSFQRIHSDNLVNFGILPLSFENPDDYEALEQGDEVEVPGAAAAVASGGKLVLRNRTRGTEIPVVFGLSERQKEIVLAGGALSLQKKQAGA